jgi:hypothetical protein
MQRVVEETPAVDLERRRMAPAVVALRDVISDLVTAELERLPEDVFGGGPLSFRRGGNSLPDRLKVDDLYPSGDRLLNAPAVVALRDVISDLVTAELERLPEEGSVPVDEVAATPVAMMCSAAARSASAEAGTACRIVSRSMTSTPVVALRDVISDLVTAELERLPEEGSVPVDEVAASLRRLAASMAQRHAVSIGEAGHVNDGCRDVHVDPQYIRQ